MVKRPAPAKRRRKLTEFSSTQAFPRAQRGARRVRRVERHTAIVRTLRRVLPAVAGLLIIACAAVVLLRQTDTLGIQFDELGLQNGRVVMKNPQVRGASPEGEPFSVTARRATQDPLSPQIVDLENVTVLLPTGDGARGTLTAISGRYDANGQTMRLDDTIQLDADDGSTLTMLGARIDLSAGNMESDGGISATYQDGDLKAGRISVFDNGNRILFTGGVSITVPPALLAEDDENGTAAQGG